MTVPSKVLLVSNGHGEDVVSERLVRALKVLNPDVQLYALATVSDGHGLAQAGCTLLDAGPTLPSGGMTLESPSALMRDLRAGLLTGLITQWRSIRQADVTAVISVGDIWAEILAAGVQADRRVAVQTLVSTRMQGSENAAGRQAFRERITLLERLVLNRRFDHVFVRDTDTAQRLEDQGVHHAAFVGNPMMDGLLPKGEASPEPSEGRRRRVLLLPGTREGAETNLAFMTEVLSMLGTVEAKVAWAKTHPPAPAELQRDGRPVSAGQATLAWTDEPFGELLTWADVAIGSTGTAVEQAAGVGTPVVTFPSPTMRLRFFENQARLLGDAVQLESRDVTAVAQVLNRWLQTPGELARRANVGRRVMGPPGAAEAIAAAALGREDAGRSPRVGHDSATRVR